MQTAIVLLAAFGIAVILDVAYARYVIAIGQKHVWTACLCSGLCTIFGSLLLLLWINEWHAVVSSAFGHALGTWLAMRPPRGV